MDLKKGLILLVVLGAITATYLLQTGNEPTVGSLPRTEPSSSVSETASTAKSTSPGGGDSSSDQNNPEEEIPEGLLRPSSSTFAPEKLIPLHTDKAASGDIDSRYLLAEVFRFCSGASSSPAELKQTFADNPQMPAYLVKRATARFNLCRPAKEQYPEFFNSEEYAQYLGVMDKHPLAILRFKTISREQRKELIRDVLSSEPPHAFFKGEALQAAVSLYSKYPGYENDFREETIQLVACKYKTYCDPVEYLEGARKFYPPSKYEELIRLALTIDEQVARGDYSELGL